MILPFSTTGLNLPPIPDPIPTTSKSGGEKYSLPPNLTSVAIILPFDAITFISDPLYHSVFLRQVFSQNLKYRNHNLFLLHKDNYL